MHGARSGWRRRGPAIGVASALVFALAACNSIELAVTSTLTVASDRTVPVSLRCTASDQPCTGSVLIRVGGLDSPAVSYSIPSSSTASVTVTLTGAQYSLVPVTGVVAAGVVVDEATPGDGGPSSRSVDLKRPGAFTARVSVATGGAPGDARSQDPSISADGRYVAFWSDASNLVPNDTNGVADVFVRDLLTRRTTRVSVSSDGSQANGTGSNAPSISADGRYIAFVSYASTNLAPGTIVSAAANSNVFVHDRTTASTSLISTSSWTDVEGNVIDYHGGSQPAISPDGRYVAFSSSALGLDVLDTNGYGDIAVADRQTGTVTRVSKSPSGGPSDSGAVEPSISEGGRYISFLSNSSNLVEDDPDGSGADIFVYDREADATTIAAAEVDDGVSSMSDDGRYLAYTTDELDPDPDDGQQTDVVVLDRNTGTTDIVSVASGGTRGDGTSRTPSISADGRHVAFLSTSSNLVPGANGVGVQLFVHDRQTGTTSRVSAASDGAPATSPIDNPTDHAISGDGRVVAFSTTASLVPDDTSPYWDVFVHDSTG